MSKKRYEDFLVEHFCKWAQTNLDGESRLQFRSPDDANSQRLYRALKKATNCSVSINTPEVNETFDAISFENAKLIPIVHSEQDDGYSENFISHLRDLVSSQEGNFKDCALVVVHNSYLDTLINSAKDLGARGEIWHPLTIKESLSELIDEIQGRDKVSQCLLNHRFKLIMQDGATMFGFAELFDALEDGVIQFDELGMFRDTTIVDWDDTAQIDKRLSRNHQLFENIHDIVERYPQELVEKLGDLELSEKFVNDYFTDGEKWKELEFGQIQQEQRANKENLLAFEKESLSGLNFIARESKKERHLIIEVPAEQREFKLEASFVGGTLQRNELKLQHTKEPITLDVNNRSNKRSIAEAIGSFNNTPLFFSIDFKREKPQERFKYRILLVPEGAFYLDDLADIFLLSPRKDLITLQTNAGKVQVAQSGKAATVTQSNQIFQTSTISEIDFAQFANETDMLTFAIQSGEHILNFEVDGAVSSETLSLPMVLDTNLYNRLYNDEFNGLYNRAKEKVVRDGKDLTPKGQRKHVLNWEGQLQDQRLLASQVGMRPEVKLDDLALHYPELHQAYTKLFDYLELRKTLLSTSSWGPKLLNIVKEVVACYLSEVEKLETKSLLSPQASLLANIGIAQFNDSEYITPYHPLTLAYFAQLVTAASSEDDASFGTLPSATLKRLNAEGLLPFVWHATQGFAYNQALAENRMWCELVTNKEANLDYVRPLVRQKANEFTKAFDVLFNQGAKETLYINSINNGDNTALFLGLVDYLKKYSPDQANRIHVNLYDKKLQRTYFDEFADAPSYDELKEIAQLGSEKDKADAVADMLKNRITYSKFKLGDDLESFNYAHISFVRNDTKVEPIPVDVQTEKTGVACHGLLAGETAYNEQNTYFTTYGLNGIASDDKPSLKLSGHFNNLAKAAWSSQKYETNNGLALKVAGELSQLLEHVYDNSVWTVIIDPKVTLDFFKAQKDAVLIHYSDNFSNSANYDAITVTKRRDLYDQVLSQGVKGLIDEFNAFNGEWLLKMITCNDNERKEKKSIIGAYKYVNCLLHQSDITWVPMSVAEMLRVAGNVGLKMSESEFSRFAQGFKSGAISDDVLFVGFKEGKMYLLPLEVKIGQKRSHGKGVKQAKELKRYLVENLFGRNDLAGHLYRGLFVRQILMQVDKFELYKVYAPGYFDELKANRAWWLQGDYQVADLAKYPQGFMMAFFENADYAKEEFVVEDDILQIRLPSANLNRFISTPLQSLLSNIQSSELCYIPEQFILGDISESSLSGPGRSDAISNPGVYKEMATNQEEQQSKERPTSFDIKSIDHDLPDVIFEKLITRLLRTRFNDEEIKEEFIRQQGAYKEIAKLADKLSVLEFVRAKQSAKELFPDDYLAQLQHIRMNCNDVSRAPKITKATLEKRHSEVEISPNMFVKDVIEAANYNALLTRLKQALGRSVTVQELLDLDESWFVRLHRVKPADLFELQKLKEILIGRVNPGSSDNLELNRIELPSAQSKSEGQLADINLLTPVSQLKVPDECEKLIERIARFSKSPLTVKNLLDVDIEQLQWQGRMTRHVLDSFTGFRERLEKSLNSLSQPNEGIAVQYDPKEFDSKEVEDGGRHIDVDSDENSFAAEALKQAVPDGIPKGIYEQIVENAQTAYFDDKDMFDIFVTDQKQAYLALEEFNKKGVPGWSTEAIKTHARDDFADDYEEQLREVNRQVEYFFKSDEIEYPQDVKKLVEIKQEAREEYPGDYKEQLAHIERELELLSKYVITDEIAAGEPATPLKVLVGHEVQENAPVHWEPTNTAKFMNTNSGIIGTMGTGKTQCTKSVVTQLYRNQHQNVDGKPIGILIFDYKSDYVDDKFLNATNGKKFNLHKLPYNPLSLFGDTPMLPVHTARGFSETMGRAFNLGQRQQLKLRRIIGEAYDLAGIHKSDKSTWQKAAPTMADLWSLFLDSDPAEDSLYAALESVCELEVFEDDNTKCMSLYDLVDGITVVELAGYPSEVQNLVVALTLDLFYSQMQKQGKPEVQGDFRQVTKLVLVDEADNFMSQNFPSLRKILKEGREYGVGVILSTQDITHFKTGENDYSAYILSWIVHRVAQIKNQDIKGIFNVDDKSEQELLMKNIRELEKHTSLYINGEKQIKRIKDKAFWELLNE